MESAVETARAISSPVLREACFEDYQEIAALQVRHGLTARSFSDWSALWTANPAYAARQPVPIGWVLESAEGSIGGYIGNLPLEYRLGGRTIRAATPYSWVVEPAYRCHSLTLLHRFLRQPGVELFVCTTPNEAAASVMRALRFVKVPCGVWDQADFWITDHRGFAESALRSLPVRLPSALLAYPLGAALYAADSVRRQPGDCPPDTSFELCRGFDARFDDFWEELESQNEPRLLAVRTRNALQWHFGSSCRRNDVWILAATRQDRLVAYGVIDRQDNPLLGLKRLRIADFQALRGYETLLRPVLAWMLEHCRRERIHVAENAGCWLERFRVPGTAGWYRRRLQSWLFYYLTHDRGLCEQLRNPEIWMPSLYDGDSSI
jgi:hypothetical protein